MEQIGVEVTITAKKHTAHRDMNIVHLILPSVKVGDTVKLVHEEENSYVYGT